MGFSKKTAKGRLDKFYYLAKEQGYRARSAFKLVQLNKKYGFLQQSRVVIDLCAAPGGWCQVAAKFMPKGQIIIGVDLCPIKPISGVITMVNDITTDKCRTDLKRELKDWKADVVLHDGAPNVGNSWVQDAYAQSELVLSSLKLATEFLIEGGWFITKVFRSKDYNSLMWVFNQLFQKVEATKPSSSRDVSAEIFVVCKGYLAPKHMDSRFLDPKSVFTDIESLMKPVKVASLFQVQKQKRSREGYEDGVNVLYSKIEALEYIRNSDFATMLATSNAIAFESATDQSALDTIMAAPQTTQEVYTCCEDLKVLGPREYKLLIKWRAQMRKLLSLADEDEKKKPSKPQPEAVTLSPEEELQQLNDSIQNKLRREKRKGLEKKARIRMRLNLQMEHGADLALDEADLSLFSLKKLKRMNETGKVDNCGMSEEEDLSLDEGSGTESNILLAKDEQAEDEKDKLNRLEAEVEEHLAALPRKQNKHQDSDEDDDNPVQSDSEAESSPESPDNLLVPIQKPDEIKAANKAKVSLWYSNPLFSSMADMAENMAKHQPLKKAKNTKQKHQASMPVDALKEEIMPPKAPEPSGKAAMKAKGKAATEAKSGAIEFVKAEDVYADMFDEDEAKEIMNSPQGMDLATRLAEGNRKKMRQALIDETFNRYSIPEKASELPGWFAEDESKHNKPERPITKEAAEALKVKMKELNDRPIKKILEAKGRNKTRSLRRLQGLKRKAEAIFNSDDMGEKSKLVQISKILKKPTVKHEKPSLVVARGHSKGIKGRPKGVKGRYKMVDSRMLKELRAQKRLKAKAKK